MKTPEELKAMTPRQRYYWRHREEELKRNAEYRKTPEGKRKHREYAAEWRKKNPEREKEITKKSQLKNRDKYNKKRVYRYHNDPEYRANKKASDLEYKVSGKRKAMRQKHLKKNAEKSKQWKLANPEKVRIRYKQYRKNKWNAHERELRKQLSDSYIIKELKNQMGNIPKEHIPSDLVEIKRIQIKTHRELKNKNQ